MTSKSMFAALEVPEEDSTPGGSKINIIKKAPKKKQPLKTLIPS